MFNIVSKENSIETQVVRKDRIYLVEVSLDELDKRAELIGILPEYKHEFANAIIESVARAFKNLKDGEAIYYMKEIVSIKEINENDEREKL